MRRVTIGLFAMGCLCLSAFSVQAAEGEGKKPDATLELTAKSVAVGIGYSWGDGTLKFQGKEYPVSVSGLGVGGVGYKSLTAFGDVYNLQNAEDFNGSYAAVGAGGTLVGGAEALRLENEKHVVIHLYTKTEGLSITIGGGGAEFKIKQPE